MVAGRSQWNRLCCPHKYVFGVSYRGCYKQHVSEHVGQLYELYSNFMTHYRECPHPLAHVVDEPFESQKFNTIQMAQIGHGNAGKTDS